MNIPRQAIIRSAMAAVFFPLFLLSSDAGFSQGGPPPLPASQLDEWILAQSNWPDIFGDAPLRFLNLNTAPGWSRAGTALSVDTNRPAFLNLSVIDRSEERRV